MQEFFEDNVYLADLSGIESISELIFQLSSILDKEEAKNRRIYLKLGNLNLNQAQLISIKSMINGIGSSLTALAALSSDTAKNAMSIGIVVSNVCNENNIEITPESTYKLAEEIKNNNLENQSEYQNGNLNNNNAEETDNNTKNIADETNETNVQEESIIEETIIENNNENQELIKDEVNIQNESIISENENFHQIEREEDIKQEQKIDNIQVQMDMEQTNVIEESAQTGLNKEEQAQEQNNQDTKYENNKGDYKDELDVIFNSENNLSNVFKQIKPQKIYTEKENLTDIVVNKEEYTKEDIEIESYPTKYIKQTIRSGQVINFDGNITIIGDCHTGSEINALGDITVWGILSGIAHAGSAGNRKARVRALKMNAIQLRIANCYSRRPDYLNEIVVEKTNSFTPEEARIINGEIVVFKMND